MQTVNELVINVGEELISIAVLEDGKLVELHREPRGVSYAVGDVCLGRIAKVIPGMNGAFVDIGSKRNGFLHYDNLDSTLPRQQYIIDSITRGDGIPPSDRMPALNAPPKGGRVEDHLKAGQFILVQITKEAIGSKGPGLTTKLSFAGRNIVLAPLGEGLNISNKISSPKEKERLKSLMRGIKPKNFAIIIRTSGEGQRTRDFDLEIKRMTRRWYDCLERLKEQRRPGVVYKESSRALGILRDTYNSSYKDIWVNDLVLLEDIRDYVQTIAPGHEGSVRYYRGRTSLFDSKGISRQIKSLMGRIVKIKYGAYLVIEQTEAMLVIDVNSGNRVRSSQEQEETAIDVNMAAAEEIARQLRLRDLGGIIAIDFIDMKKRENQEKLNRYMAELLSTDKAKHNIQPLSKFCVMELTRQRVRSAVQIETEDVCDTCHGTGRTAPSIFVADEIEESLKLLVEEQKPSYINIRVNPLVEAYLKQGLWSIARRWWWTISHNLRVTADESLSVVQYKFLDIQGRELRRVARSRSEDMIDRGEDADLSI